MGSLTEVVPQVLVRIAADVQVKNRDISAANQLVDSNWLEETQMDKQFEGMQEKKEKKVS